MFKCVLLYFPLLLFFPLAGANDGHFVDSYFFSHHELFSVWPLQCLSYLFFLFFLLPSYITHIFTFFLNYFTNFHRGIVPFHLLPTHSSASCIIFKDIYDQIKLLLIVIWYILIIFINSLIHYFHKYTMSTSCVVGFKIQHARYSNELPNFLPSCNLQSSRKDSKQFGFIGCW